MQALNAVLPGCSVFGFYDDLEVYNPDEGSTTGAKEHADENDVRCGQGSGSNSHAILIPTYTACLVPLTQYLCELVLLCDGGGWDVNAAVVAALQWYANGK